DRAAARDALDIPRTARVVALMPGSRMGEVSRLGPDFIATARWLLERRPDLSFIAPMATPLIREVFAAQCASAGMRIQLFDGQAHRALGACDAALVASGTATLEALLVNRPMVVAYRLSAVTAF